MKNYWKKVKLSSVIILLDSKRIPLSSMERSKRQGKYRYFGAQGIIDYIDDFLFDGRFLLIAEDGNNLKSNKEKIAQLVDGKFWVNNHAHVVQTNNKCLIEYLYYVINNMDISAYITGSAQPKLNQDNLLKIEIYLPNIEIQKKIAKVLSAFDDKIELNNKINENLEKQFKLAYTKSFIENKDKIKKELKPLSNIFFFQEGPGIRNWQYVTNNGIKFINIRCINNGIIDITNANMISKEEANGKYSHFLLDDMDIVMSCSGTLGRYAIVTKEVLPLCLNTSVIRFKPIICKEDFSYLYGYLTSPEFLNKQQEMACGSVQSNFGPTHLNKIEIEVPSLNERIEFHNKYFKLILQILNNRKENNILAKIRDTLLPKLMSGELKV